jgi:hypothetical protein
MRDEHDPRLVVLAGHRNPCGRDPLTDHRRAEQQRGLIVMAPAQVRDRALDRRQQFVVGHREPAVAEPLRDRLGADVAAVREQHQRATRRPDPLEHVDGAGQRPGAAVRIAVDERPVDVEHESAHAVQTQAAVAQLSRHGARPRCRRPCAT